MNFNSSGYFAYKKNKIQSETEDNKKPISRLNFLLQLFGATFVIMFIIIVVSIMKYSSKVDIEYSQGELQLSGETMNSISGYPAVVEEDRQRQIDKRLILIQQEENAPSEARIVEKPKDEQHEVISMAHVENNKKIEKLEKQKKLNEEAQEKPSSKLAEIIDEVKLQKKVQLEVSEPQSNVVVMSKVLVGRYTTFEEAQQLQNDIKTKNPSLSPFVRKVGGVYSVQMGSFADFSVAKNHAQSLKSKGFDVWIYQQ